MPSSVWTTLGNFVVGEVNGDTWFLDEVFVTIRGERRYVWRAVDGSSLLAKRSGFCQYRESS